MTVKKVKILKPQAVKILKMVHILSSLTWVVGCIALTILMFITFPKTGDELYMRSVVLKIVDDYLIIAGIVTSILTGLVYSIWTNWGFFKHRWIIVKWIMAIMQATFGGVVLGRVINENVIIANNLRDAALTDPVFLQNMRILEIFSPPYAILTIFLIFVSVQKPWKKKKASQSET